jgi:CRISPR-associated protein Csx17
VTNLVAVALRRDLYRQSEIAGSDRFADAAASGIRDRSHKFGKPRRWPTFADICLFIDDTIDEQRLEALTRGLMLIDWPLVDAEAAPRDLDTPVPASFVLLLLARELELEPPLARTPGLLTNAAAGYMQGACALAVRRLAGGGRRFPRSRLHEPGERTRRMAAALAFPFATSQLQILERQLFPRLQDHSIKDTTP